MVGYHLALPPLARVYKTFHVSMLRKYILDPNHVIEFGLLQLKKDLSYEEQLVRIVNRKYYF